MKTIKIPIIPIKQTFAKVRASHIPNYEAICIFTAIGFFLDQDTYWKDEIVLRPGTSYTTTENNLVIDSKTNFSWYHEPRDINFKTAVNEFTDLFEAIVKEQSGNDSVVLPLSGGLDSRTQAAALEQMGAEVQSYSYSFKNGFQEHIIGKKIAQACNFKFEAFEIPQSYLWEVIEDMALINACYSEFTHPRQIAVLHDLKRMKGQFSLGHWGDVLFDKGFSEVDSRRSDVEIIFNKLVKKGGLELASKLWTSWGLDGDFETYLKQRIQDLLNNINITDKSAKIRAFKSLYWAPRWTSVSLSFFEAAHPINLPYYDNRMCRFICEIPEKYLADRKIQIEYIKNRSPKLAAIEWQNQMPFNLYNYEETQFLKRICYRVQTKLQREMIAFSGNRYTQRNWELQFLGQSNSTSLEKYLFDTNFKTFLNPDIVADMYDKFKTKDMVFYSHAISVLLTLSLWNKTSKQKTVF